MTPKSNRSHWFDVGLVSGSSQSSSVNGVRPGNTDSIMAPVARSATTFKRLRLQPSSGRARSHSHIPDVTAPDLERDTTTIKPDGRYDGRVAHTDGTGLDQPLNLIRMGYGYDWGDEKGYGGFGPVAMSMHYNWHGDVDLMPLASGAARRCLPDVIFGLHYRCVDVWLAAKDAFFRSQYKQPKGGASWYGGLLRHQADASGQVYMRNRYYDPETGRFTQEDPIGVAGGVNVYGYAGGDPVNYSDPFGLWCEKDGDPCPSPIGQVVDQVNAHMSAAVANLAIAAAHVAGEIIDAATGLVSLMKAALGRDENNSKLSGTQRALAGAAFIAGGLANAEGPLARGIAKTIDRAQGAQVTFSELGRFVRATWEVPGNKGAGFVRWNRILDSEGNTTRLFKDVYNQGGKYLRRDWYVGGPK